MLAAIQAGIFIRTYVHQQKVTCNPTCGSVLIVLIAPCQQHFLLPYTQKHSWRLHVWTTCTVFFFVQGIYRALKFVSSSDSLGLSSTSSIIVRISPSYSGWHQWPLEHTSVQTWCRWKEQYQYLVCLITLWK